MKNTSLDQQLLAPAETSRDQWWRCFFADSEDAQLICSSQGEILDANRNTVQLLGLNRGVISAKARSVFDFLTGVAAIKLEGWLVQRGKGRRAISSVTLNCEGKLSHLVDLRFLPLDDDHFLLTIKDASSRWRMESHVQRLLTAVDATPDVVFLTDTKFRLTFVNSAFQTVTGYGLEEALGRTADFLRAPDQHDKTAKCLESMEQGLDWRGEFINLRHDGTSYPIEASISPIYDKEGGFLGYAAFERDITQQKKLQHELELERNAVLSIINSIESAVYTMDREFRLSHINDGWKKMPPSHGWLTLNDPPQIGRALLDYVENAQNQLELDAGFRRVLKELQPLEIRAATNDGHHWLIKIAPWRVGEEVRGLTYVVIDQTKFHQLQSQLFQAQKMETIGALAAGVAHDFNNLLQAIRGNVSLLLLDQQLNDKTRLRLERIDQAANRSAGITQQLLSFSRASDENETILDFNQVIREAGDLVKRSLMSKVELLLAPAESPLKVRMDPTRAHQVLLNLCLNAQDAMPQGGRLTLRNALVPLTAEQAAGMHIAGGTDFLRSSVMDTGVGIAPELMGRIFDPFFTTKAKGKGTGLGLSIVHSVITQAGGFLEIKSTPGKGTTFDIYLPIVEANLSSAAPTTQSSLLKGTGRILVVDDLDLVQDFARTFLKSAGYDVLVASSAEEALEILENEAKTVDLLFTDYNMPGKSGRQLIHETAARWPHMKFILVSGFLEDSDRQQIEKEYGAQILNKPFHIAEAATLVAKMLGTVSHHSSK